MDEHGLKVVDIVVLAAILLSLMCPANPMDIAHNTTITLEFCGSVPFPVWYMNGSVVQHPQYQTRVDLGSGGFLGILSIDGNEMCGNVIVSCTVLGQTVYTGRLTIEGPLPPPENVTLSFQNSSTQLQWKPPYYKSNVTHAMNKSGIHVDPHITQYTVYITDNYTGDVVKVNVTETQYTPNIQQNNSMCPMYQFSAWNAAGEGELSSPVWDSTPQVPLVENINVTVTAEPGVLQFHIEVGVVCSSRMPEFFLVTLSESETTRHHQRDFPISRPPNLDVCTIQPRISAGNAAGTSPIGTVVVVCPGDSTDSTVSSATTVSTAAGTESEREEDRQQGISTTLIAIVIGVITAILGALIAIATVGYICYRKYKRRNSKVDSSDKTDNFYSKSPSPYKPEVPEADYEQTTSRDPERARGRFTSSDSAGSTSSTSSGRSDDPLLPPSPPVQAKSPHKGIYADVDPLKQTPVHPPAKEEPVFYSQIKH